MSLLGQIRWSGVGRLAGLAVGALAGLVGLGAIAGEPQAPRLSDEIGLGSLAPAAQAAPPPAEPPRITAAERRPASGRDRGERERSDAARRPGHKRGKPAGDRRRREGNPGMPAERPTAAPPPARPSPSPPPATPAPAAPSPAPAPASPAPPSPSPSSEFDFEH